jgi:heme-degrading monooxygenase HmoA
MYWVIWRYKIKESSTDAFESGYGPMGTWANFFSKAIGYQGSRLLRDAENVREYVLIDQWNSQPDYEAFLDMERASYQQMSTNCEMLYISEVRIGAFHTTE